MLLKKYLEPNICSVVLPLVDTRCASLPEKLTYTLRRQKSRTTKDLPDAEVGAT